MNVKEDYEYIVIGGGSAGCVVTNRLAKAGKQVLLIEEGPADNSFFIHTPATFVKVHGTERTFIYRSKTSPEMAGRATTIPQGRTLGGGSSVNGMVYIRGQAEDYNDWEKSGCVGWGWDNVLPVFIRAEGNERLADEYHGTTGSMKVSDPKHRHPLAFAFVRAAQEAGYPYNDDFNGKSQEGVGFYQTTTFNGKRASTAATYLADVKHLSNVTVLTDASVQRLILDNTKVTGVSYKDNKGIERSVSAKKEVILSAGALASPKILMHSGIGPEDVLNAVDIEPVKVLNGVGKNYQDHLEVAVYARTKEPISLLGQDSGFKALKNGLQYLAFNSGLLTSTVVEVGGFMDSTGEGRPDVQFHVLPTLVGDADREPLEGHGISLNPSFLRPKSRGEVRIISNNPADQAEIDSQYLTDPSDMDTLLRALKIARNIVRQPSLSALIDHELLPSAEEDVSDDVLIDHIRKYSKTVYHPSGTCKMGTDDEAVVDPKLCVYGIENLRICDASIMPILVSGNTNAPVVMIAERCADFILE
ncbi:MAG: FAD-dependent oxidoreductase [Halioglobus sp.]